MRNSFVVTKSVLYLIEEMHWGYGPKKDAQYTTILIGWLCGRGGSGTCPFLYSYILGGISTSRPSIQLVCMTCSGTVFFLNTNTNLFNSAEFTSKYEFFCIHIYRKSSVHHKHKYAHSCPTHLRSPSRSVVKKNLTQIYLPTCGRCTARVGY